MGDMPGDGAGAGALPGDGGRTPGGMTGGVVGAVGVKPGTITLGALGSYPGRPGMFRGFAGSAMPSGYTRTYAATSPEGRSIVEYPPPQVAST